jgi:hypothetical protein
VDATEARNHLDLGLARLKNQEKDWDKREDYFQGKQDLPYAPEGVNEEYEALQRMAIANLLEIAMNGPIQRLQADGFRTGRNEKADQAAWTELWQPNKLDSRQGIVYRQMFIHGRGVMSVSPNKANRKSPKIRPESSRRVWIEPNPEDPFEPLFTVKKFTVTDRAPSKLILPDSMSTTKQVAYVYGENDWFKFGALGGSTDWQLEASGQHNMNGNPFVPFDFNVDADGVPHPAITKLMPQQDAINTIRFNTLLAMQFSAFRQRVFTGFDPVVRDDKGRPLVKRDPNTNEPILDANGMQQPIVRSPGRVGVDRALVFPGDQTKVFDLAESNLDNYITVLDKFLNDFMVIGQIPPAYALTKMANTSGDAMSGAESTFQSLERDLKRAAGESLEQVMRLGNVARGEQEPDVASEVIWADTEIRSFAQIVDAIGKLITSGMSRKDAWSMLPNATPPKVSEWVENSDSDREAADAALLKMAGA